MYRYLVLALVLTGCGGTFQRPANLYDPNMDRFPFHYGTPYVDLFWRCMTPEAAGISVDGYAATSTNQNLPPQNFGVTLKAFNADGQKLTERFAWGDNLNPDASSPIPFEVAIPAVSGVARYDLYYAFYVWDGRQRLSQFGTVEDACGARWQRKAGQTVY